MIFKAKGNYTKKTLLYRKKDGIVHIVCSTINLPDSQLLYLGHLFSRCHNLCTNFTLIKAYNLVISLYPSMKYSIIVSMLALYVHDYKIHLYFIIDMHLID